MWYWLVNFMVDCRNICLYIFRVRQSELGMQSLQQIIQVERVISIEACSKLHRACRQLCDLFLKQLKRCQWYLSDEFSSLALSVQILD